MIRAVLHESDNLVQISNLKDILTGDFILNASVEAIILDSAEAEILGPFVLTPTDEEGEYIGLIPDTVDLKSDGLYSLKITVDDGPGRRVVEKHNLEITESLQ